MSAPGAPSRQLAIGLGLFAAFLLGFGIFGALFVRGDDPTVVATSDGRTVSIGVGWPGSLDSCVTDEARTVLPNCYREKVDNASFVKQPASTFSTLAFCAVGLFILGHVDRTARRGERGPMSRQEETWLGFVALAMGPGSALFHGTLTGWGGWFDMLSMCALLAFIVTFELTRLRRAPERFARWFWAMLAIAALLKGVTGELINYVFIVAGVGVGVFALVSWITLLRRVGLRRDGGRLALAFAFLGSSIVPWLLSSPEAGEPTSVPYHSAWHVLSAVFVLAYWWYLQSERPLDPPVGAGTVAPDDAANRTRV